MPSTFVRLSSGEPAIVCASRRPLGVRGACCCAIDWERMEGVWEELAEGGDVGRREDMMDEGECLAYYRLSRCICKGRAESPLSASKM